MAVTEECLAHISFKSDESPLTTATPLLYLLFTSARGFAELQSLTKIGLTRGCSSARKSLVKGERLVRYVEKPE